MSNHCQESCCCDTEHSKEHIHVHEHSCSCGCHENSENRCGCHEGCGCEHGEENEKLLISRMILSAVLLVLGIVLHPAFSIIGYVIIGYDILITAVKSLVKGKAFDEMLLMSIASLGALIIGEYSEAVLVMLLYQFGEMLQEKAVGKSRSSISALLDIKPEYANIETENGFLQVSPESVKIGDIITVKPGERIPLDGEVSEGVSMIDTSAVTGESVPESVKCGDKVFSGCINMNGALKIKVTADYKNSTVAKIMELTENSLKNKSQHEKFISKFARIYTPIVVAAAAIVAVIPSIITGNVSEWVYRALIFLVISCPCALVISVPLGYFAGIGKCADNGILIKGSTFIDVLAKTKLIAFDKTGTLTSGSFAVHNADKDVLEIAAHAEMLSNHPIAHSIVEAYGDNTDMSRVSDFTEIAGLGIKANIDGDEVLCGSSELMRRYNIEYPSVSKHGVYVAQGGKFIGYIEIYDEIKKDSAESIKALKKMQIKTAMLTGDDKNTAEAVGAEIGLSEIHSGLLPHEKAQYFEKLSQNQTSAFVGDGINDAPVLASADVGIAMGGLGSDAAIEASDCFLMHDEPSAVVTAVKICRRTVRVVKQNIFFSIGIKLAFMILGVAGIANMWMAIFADVGVSFIAVLNSVRILRK